jgi:hypothetical protein
MVMYCKISHVIRIWFLPIGLGQRSRLTFYSLVPVRVSQNYRAQIFLSVCKGEAAIENVCTNKSMFSVLALEVWLPSESLSTRLVPAPALSERP